MNREGAEVTSTGRAFQTRAPATEKARRPTVVWRQERTDRPIVRGGQVEDRKSLCRDGMSVTGVNCPRCWGASPCSAGRSALRPWTQSFYILALQITVTLCGPCGGSLLLKATFKIDWLTNDNDKFSHCRWQRRQYGAHGSCSRPIPLPFESGTAEQRFPYHALARICVYCLNWMKMVSWFPGR